MDLWTNLSVLNHFRKVSDSLNCLTCACFFRPINYVQLNLCFNCFQFVFRYKTYFDESFCE